VAVSRELVAKAETDGKVPDETARLKAELVEVTAELAEAKAALASNISSRSQAAVSDACTEKATEVGQQT
jgi:hypothetical protein